MILQNFLQTILLNAFARVSQASVLKSNGGRLCYQWAYDLYKRALEVPGYWQLQKYASRGTTVIDVGANIGFFTLRFADWVGPRGRVIALEPDDENFQWLGHRIGKRRDTKNIHLMQAAATSFDGTVRLTRNPAHPGDHRIGESGVEVQAVTIDSLSGRFGSPSMIKIDVQGAEMQVLAGALATIRRARPALLIEVDDKALQSYGSSARALIRRMIEEDYRPYILERNSLVPLTAAMQSGDFGRAYCDILFLPLLNGSQS